ncbi:hypothetical protein [Phenylobacterium sp.]|uniref:hypothetical protein n=1 Tax=Phenylobacterium sp. TaxID=1871053 RepID=UPI002F3FA552
MPALLIYATAAAGTLALFAQVMSPRGWYVWALAGALATVWPLLAVFYVAKALGVFPARASWP